MQSVKVRAPLKNQARRSESITEREFTKIISNLNKILDWRRNKVFELSSNKGYSEREISGNPQQVSRFFQSAGI